MHANNASNVMMINNLFIDNEFYGLVGLVGLGGCKNEQLNFFTNNYLPSVIRDSF